MSYLLKISIVRFQKFFYEKIRFQQLNSQNSNITQVECVVKFNIFFLHFETNLKQSPNLALSFAFQGVKDSAGSTSGSAENVKDS